MANADGTTPSSSFMELFQNLLTSSGAHAMTCGLTSFDQLPDISIEVLEQEEAAMEEMELEMAEVEEEEVGVESEEEEVEEAETEENTDEDVEQAAAEVKEEIVAELAARTQSNTAEKVEVVEENTDESAFILNKQEVVAQDKKAQGKEGELEANLTQQNVQEDATSVATQQKVVNKVAEVAKEVEYDGRKIGDGEKPSELVFTLNKAFDPARDAVGKPFSGQLENSSARYAQDPQAMIQNAVESAVGKNGGNHTGAETRSNTAEMALNLADAAKKGNSKASSAEKSESNLPGSLQDKIIDKIQKMLESAKMSRQGTSMVVRLDPPELGRVTVKMTHRGDQMFARIIPESSDVEATLRARSAEIVNTLVSSGFKAENVNVSFGSESVAHTPSHFEHMLDNRSSDNEQQASQGRFNTMPGNSSPEAASAAMSEVKSQEQSGWVA
jgi:flagellar hook-length control protein FliK